MIFRDWLKELDYTLLQGSVDVETEDVIYDFQKSSAWKGICSNERDPGGLDTVSFPRC